MIALLAYCPLRRRNLTQLSIGESLARTGTGWHIVLGRSDTKTHVPLEREIPEVLVSLLETYIAVHRPILLARRGRWTRDCGNQLWISSDGSPLTQDGIYPRIVRLTERELGVAFPRTRFETWAQQPSQSTTQRTSELRHLSSGTLHRRPRRNTTTRRTHSLRRGRTPR